MTDVSRVLVLAPTPFFGDRGCHVRIYEESRHLQRLGLEVLIVTYPVGLDPEGLSVSRATRVPGVRPSELGPSWGRPVLDASLLVSTLSATRRFRPQVVHAHLHEGIAIGSVVRAITRVPLVADLQGSLTAELIDHRFVKADGSIATLCRRLERKLVQLPDALVVSSSAGIAMLQEQGVDPARIRSLPDGVDLDDFQPRAPDPELVERLGLRDRRVIVFLGVLTGYQGVDNLLRAMPAVRQAVPDVHLLLMGYPNVERYQDLVDSMKLTDVVTLPGRIPYDEAPNWLSLGDVAVSMKESETEANGKLLNYMGCGLPVVATDTDVNHELLGEAGRYVSIGDPKGLAEALVTMLGSAELRRDLGAALRQRAEREFSWAVLAQRLTQTYGEVVRDR